MAMKIILWILAILATAFIVFTIVATVKNLTIIELFKEIFKTTETTAVISNLKM